MEFEQLRAKVQEYLSAEKLALVEAAYRFAAEAHEGQMRKSGDARST